MGNPDLRRVSYGAVTVLPIAQDRSGRVLAWHSPTRCCCGGDVSSHCKNAIFLLIHAAFAWSAALLLLAAALLSVALVPVCGLGILVFKLIFRLGIVDFFAKYDAALTNFIAPPEEQILINITTLGDNEPLLDDCAPPERLISGLTTLTVESAMVLVYLVTIKLILASIGVFIVGLVMALPILLLTSLFWDAGALTSASSSNWEVLCVYFALVLVFLIAVISMDLMVTLCGSATRFFCCEHVYTLPLPRPGASTTARMRPNVVVIRLPSSSSGVYALASSVTSSAPSS